MKRNISAMLVLLWLGACSHYSLVPPKPTEVGGAYSVNPQIAWSQAKNGSGVIWTVDGPLLHALYLYGDLEDGDTLFELQDKKKKLPEFQSSMRANEVMEMVVASLLKVGVADVQTSGLRPARFGGAEGFRFEMAMVTEDGLETAGMAIGTIVNERLQLIIYTGARSHYFPKYQEKVEKLIASIQLET